MEDKLKKYAEYKTLAKDLEVKMEELKPEIIAFLEEQGVDKLPTNLGTFTISPFTTWKYSEAVKELQETEKATGIAKKVVSNSLRFTGPKADE